MRKTILIIILLTGTINLLNAQIIQKDDTIIHPLDPPFRVFCTNSNNIIEFTATKPGHYSITVENDGLLIEDNEIMLNAGESHIIDLSAYPAGTYRVIVRDIISCKEYEYFFTKQDDDFELF